MEDTFVIYHDGRPLVTLTNLGKGKILPTRENVLDWYGRNYCFERSKLTGCFLHSISVKDMSYEDFINERPAIGNSTSGN